MGEDQRTRRFDPDRRQRIIEAAVLVIAEHGVAGTTHRRIAVRADVPLGSLTYHFASLDDLLYAAFERVADTGSRAMLDRLNAATNVEEAIVAVVEVIADRLWSDPDTLLLSYELYAYAARRPAMTVIMRDWLARSQTALQRHFTPLVARGIDALIEGLGIHGSVAERKLTRGEVEALVRQLADATRLNPST